MVGMDKTLKRAARAELERVAADHRRVERTSKRAARCALEQADQHRARAAELERLIREHHRQIHAGNWGFDDELWAALGLEADVEVIG